MGNSISIAELEAFPWDTANPRPWLEGLRASGRKASTKALDRLRELLVVERSRAKPRPGRVHHLLAAGLVLTDGDLAFDYETLREVAPSVVPDSFLSRLEDVFRQLAETSEGLLGRPELRARWLSLAELAALRRSSIRVRHAFRENLAKLPPPGLLSILLRVEHQFAGFAPPLKVYPGLRLSHHPMDLGLESYAAGASFLLTTLQRLGGIRPDRIGAFPPDQVVPESFDELVTIAAHLFELDESEVDVVRGGYVCIRLARRHWRIEAPDDRLGRSRELGWLKNDLSLAAPAPRDGEPTLREAIEHFYEVFGSRVFKFLQGQVKFLRMQVAEPLARHLGEKLAREELFYEEAQMLYESCYELVVEVDDLRTFDVLPGLSLWDVFVATRILRFITLARNKALEPLRMIEPHTFLNATFPLLTTDSLVQFLEWFGVSAAKAQAYVSLLTWDTSVAEAYADLQYRPFVKIGSYVLPLMNVLANSNIIRNALQVAKRRPSAGTARDQVSAKLAEALRSVTPDVAEGRKFRFAGEASDLDVTARIGDTLFAFECKNTLQPCSSFEMRSTWDQLDKAGHQLSRLRRLWKEPGFRKLLESKLGFSLAGVERLETGIVLSHRLLSGARWQGHSIRHLHELARFVRVGEGEVETFGHAHRMRWWHGDRFTGADLVAYLSDESPPYAPFWAAMIASDVQLGLDDVRIIRPRFAVDLGKFLANTGAPASLIDEYEASMRELAERGDQTERRRA